MLVFVCKSTLRRFRLGASLIVITLAGTFPIAAAEVDNAVGEAFEPHVYQSDSDGTLPYRLLKPESLDSGRKYPLVRFLHGAGERGGGPSPTQSRNDRRIGRSGASSRTSLHGVSESRAQQLDANVPTGRRLQVAVLTATLTLTVVRFL